MDVYTSGGLLLIEGGREPTGGQALAENKELGEKMGVY